MERDEIVIRCRWTAWLAIIVLAVGIAPLLPAAGAGERGIGTSRLGGIGTSRLKRDVRILRSRVERAPRATSYDLDRLDRRLHDQRLRTPRDPQRSNLELEVRRLRWDADRAVRRQLGRRAPTMGITAPPASAPRFLGGSHTSEVTSGSAIGGRIVALQTELHTIEAGLDGGTIEAASERLDAAAAELLFLKDGLSPATADDPNLIALARQIDTLKTRLNLVGE